MKLPTFKLEEYFSRTEFKAPYLMCCSDAESFSLQEILALADDETRSIWETLRLGYTQVQGSPLLRSEIAHLYPGLQADNILCCAGAEEGIFCTFFSLLNKESHAIVVTPCYQSLHTLALSFAGSVTTIALDEAHGWKLDLDRVKDAIRPNTRLIIINFPNNPTGALLNENEVKDLIDIASSHDMYIFSDEAYRLLGSSCLTWDVPLACLYPKVISLSVMSKAFGMAGLRIGWIATQNKELLKSIEFTKYYTTICNSGLSEVVSLIALRAKDIVLKRNCEIIDHNLSLLDSFFSRNHTLFSWVRPAGGCVGLVNSHIATPIDIFAQELVDNTGVLIIPGSVFDIEGNTFRIGFGRKNFPEVLEKFETYVSRYLNNSCQS
ncbi:aminotransferase class I/II-fold pyridoxal phosphate-dependent enzyme [Nostoc sp. PCC 9305]|uniref:aminotransferase class I/II-fold pyridoxal phosphate-dependent enzyme n=1 Tax=Nostoc sp. PCC 9305 TaxID=296636 RepID=UPI0039C615E4